MIQKIKILSYQCDHEIELPNGEKKLCGNKKIVNAQRFTDMKMKGWAVAADGKCYCPNHAPFHRHVGRGPKVRKFVQIRLEDIDGRQ